MSFSHYWIFQALKYESRFEMKKYVDFGAFMILFASPS